MNQIHLTDPTAEEYLIGACLESTTALISVVGSGLKPEDFNGPGNEIMYRTMRDMLDRGESVDPTTLAAKLEAGGKLELIGGQGVINRLTEASYITHHASDYAEIIRDRSIRRSMSDAVEDIMYHVHSEEDIRQLMGTAENLVYRVSDKLRSGGKQGLKAEDLIEIYRKKKKAVERIPYPLLSINHATGGRERGCLTLWGGYSSDGKTVMGMQSALVAAEHGHRVGYFSLEMTEEELLYRLLAMKTGIPKAQLEHGLSTLDQQDAVDKALQDIKHLDLVTFHDPEYTPDEIRSIQMKEKFNLIVVDYLQRFYFKDWKEIPAMAKKFKNIALSTKCSVDVLSQLTPAQVGVGDNPFPPPSLNSFYGGKATAHEANNALFIYAHRRLDAGNWVRTGGGEIIIGKQRGGHGEYSLPVVFDQKSVVWRDRETVPGMQAENK